MSFYIAPRLSKVCNLERDPDGLAKINLKRNLFCELTHPPGWLLYNDPVSKHLLSPVYQGQRQLGTSDDLFAQKVDNKTGDDIMCTMPYIWAFFTGMWFPPILLMTII